MSPLKDLFRNLLTPNRPLPAGIHHYQSPPEDPRNYRLHLRLEQDGSGILIINAATVLHLNQTAAEYAYYLVQNLVPEEASRRISARYNVSRAQALQDYQDLIDRIQTLINSPDLDPVTFLDVDRLSPFSGSVSAPYRLDCALTYRLPDADAPESAPVERVKHELSTSEWQTVLEKACQAGIPHVVFTGGEPTLRPDLPDLLTFAERNDLVTGLLSDGLRLTDPEYLNRLLQTGLDHFMLILRPELELSWEALRNTLEADLFVAVHLTLTEANTAVDGQIAALIARLAESGLKAISLSASSPNLAGALETARDQSADRGLELIWNLPVPYSAINPVFLETGQTEDQRGAGRAWLYAEPDGDVLPGQGIIQVLGNLLNDPWEKIWKEAQKKG